MNVKEKLKLELRYLTEGLEYIPTKKENISEIYSSIRLLHKRIKKLDNKLTF